MLATCSLPLIALRPESYSLSNYLAALNTSSPAHVDVANSIWIDGCGDERRNVGRACNLARAATGTAKADVVRGVHSPFGFSAMFISDRSSYPFSYYLNRIFSSKGLIHLKSDLAHAAPPRLA